MILSHTINKSKGRGSFDKSSLLNKKPRKLSGASLLKPLKHLTMTITFTFTFLLLQNFVDNGKIFRFYTDKINSVAE